MLVSPSAPQFAEFLSHAGLSDARLVNLFGVSQSTVSRLRNGKIKKIGKYWVTLQESGALTGGTDEQFAERMAELQKAAKSSSALRVLLENLHNFMQEWGSH